MASDAGSALRRMFDAARAFAAAPPPVIALPDRDIAAWRNATPMPTGSGLTSSEPQEDADFQTLVRQARTGLDRMFVGENFATVSAANP